MTELENMRPWEKVEMLIKRHWIVYFMLFIYFLLWVIITIIIFGFFKFNIFTNLIICLFWMVFSLFLYVERINYELDMFVLTNNRIIWIEQISFLNRTVTECNLWQVQEVNSRTSWFFANIFNYWTIDIQTAWSVTTLKMDFAPDSLQKSRIILNTVDHYRDSQHLKVHEETVDGTS